MTDLSHVRTWVFDLDNTLYPAHCNLFDQIDQRMGAFIGRLLNVDAIEARRVQKDYFVRYGTTLRGLMDHHDVEPEDFLHQVHDIDVSAVPPNPDLAAVLDRLPGRKLVFTNASAPYANKVLDRLGITRQIDDVFDITAADYVPKPAHDPYHEFLRRYEVAPESALMVEDMARNLKPAAALGMTTAWLKTSYTWGDVHLDPDVIHHQLDDLTAWLARIAEKGGTSNIDSEAPGTIVAPE